MAPEFEGHVDRIEAGWILGWVWVPEVPDNPIEIDVLIDGASAGTWRADLYRPDLETAGKGNGRHAFEVRLPPEIMDGTSHEIRILCAGANADLHGSPAAICFTSNHGASVAMSASKEHTVTYRSRFGGLWTDLPNALDVIAGKQALGWISPAEAQLLADWLVNGFVIIPQAVPHTLIDELDLEVERIWDGGGEDRFFVEFWENGEKTIQRAGPRFKDKRVKLLDLFAHLECARRIIFETAIVRFLTLVFERPALAFQSLYFRWGSQQDIHQDTAFVKVSAPLEFAASWIALEDIRADSGELEYYVGSHKLEDYLFEGGSKWMPFRSTEYEYFINSLHERSRERGLERQRFLPQKGDALIWSADLAHGGSKNAAEGVTRKSIVTHYCPASCEPVYAVPGVTYPCHMHDTSAFYTFAPRD